jgi:hypothetical protein
VSPDSSTSGIPSEISSPIWKKKRPAHAPDDAFPATPLLFYHDCSTEFR